MLGGVFWKSWPDYVVSVKSDLTPGAELRAQLASSGSLSVLLREREAPSDRQVSGQQDKSPALETFGLTPQLKYTYICLEIVVSGGWFFFFFFGKVGDRFTSWEDLKRSMMLRLSEQVRWSLRLLLRPPHRWSIKGIYKALPALRGVNDNIWWLNRDVALAL